MGSWGIGKSWMLSLLLMRLLIPRGSVRAWAWLVSQVLKKTDYISGNFLLWSLGKNWVLVKKDRVHWFHISSQIFIDDHGIATSSFQILRRFRQEEPPSTYLFIPLMEALSRSINRAVQGGFINDFKVSSRSGDMLEFYIFFLNFNFSFNRLLPFALWS